MYINLSKGTLHVLQQVESFARAEEKSEAGFEKERRWGFPPPPCLFPKARVQSMSQRRFPAKVAGDSKLIPWHSCSDWL